MDASSYYNCLMNKSNNLALIRILNAKHLNFAFCNTLLIFYLDIYHFYLSNRAKLLHHLAIYKYATTANICTYYLDTDERPFK